MNIRVEGLKVDFLSLVEYKEFLGKFYKIDNLDNREYNSLELLKEIDSRLLYTILNLNSNLFIDTYINNYREYKGDYSLNSFIASLIGFYLEEDNKRTILEELEEFLILKDSIVNFKEGEEDFTKIKGLELGDFIYSLVENFKIIEEEKEDAKGAKIKEEIKRVEIKLEYLNREKKLYNKEVNKREYIIVKKRIEKLGNILNLLKEELSKL